MIPTTKTGRDRNITAPTVTPTLQAAFLARLASFAARFAAAGSGFSSVSVEVEFDCAHLSETAIRRDWARAALKIFA